MKTKLAAAVAIPALALLAACSSGGNSSDGNATPTNTDPVASTRASNPPLAPASDVTVSSCKPGAGGTEVVAQVKNSTDKALTYVAAVEILVDGKKQDGVAVIANGVKAGATAEAKNTGQKRNLKGKVTCKVAGVEMMPA